MHHNQERTMSQTASIRVYRTRGCPFCVMAADFFEDQGLTVDEVFLDDHPDRQGYTNDILPGHRTVPLIVIDDHPIGGFDALRALHSSGELSQLVRKGA